MINAKKKKNPLMSVPLCMIVKKKKTGQAIRSEFSRRILIFIIRRTDLG